MAFRITYLHNLHCIVTIFFYYFTDEVTDYNLNQTLLITAFIGCLTEVLLLLLLCETIHRHVFLFLSFPFSFSPDNPRITRNKHNVYLRMDLYNNIYTTVVLLLPFYLFAFPFLILLNYFSQNIVLSPLCSTLFCLFIQFINFIFSYLLPFHRLVRRPAVVHLFSLKNSTFKKKNQKSR